MSRVTLPGQPEEESGVTAKSEQTGRSRRPLLLDRSACGRIHDASLNVLQTVGVRVDDAATLRLLLDAGATPKADGVVGMPRELVEWALGQTPKSARFADRGGAVRELGPGAGTMVLTGNALYVSRGRERRDLRSEDLAELARIVDACPNVHGMVGTTIADLPALSRDFAGFRIMAEHTNKHLRPCMYSPAGARLVMEMAQVLLGGVSLREQPIVSTGFSILSPLHWTSLALGVFRETAGRGVPVMINSEPLGGGTAPVTLAGCLVVGNADVLSGLVINQLFEPGRPCIYNLGFAHVLDMAAAIALTGSPENALLQAAGADLAQYHGLPSASWMSTEAMVMDEQAAFEKMMMGLAHAAAGVNLIWGAGNLESTLAMSPEALVADDEIAGYFLRFQRGFELDEESLALATIHEIGLKGDFLTSEHTLRYYREVLSRPRLAVRSRRSAWESAGARKYVEAAEERVRSILSREPAPKLDESQVAELQRIEQSGLNSIGAT